MFWCGLFRIYICGIKLFGPTICLVSGIATKAAMLSQSHFPYVVDADQTKLFSSKIFALKSILQIVGFMVLF